MKIWNNMTTHYQVLFLSWMLSQEKICSSLLRNKSSHSRKLDTSGKVLKKNWLFWTLPRQKIILPMTMLKLKSYKNKCRYWWKKKSSKQHIACCRQICWYWKTACHKKTSLTQELAVLKKVKEVKSKSQEALSVEEMLKLQENLKEKDELNYKLKAGCEKQKAIWRHENSGWKINWRRIDFRGSHLKGELSYKNKVRH